jgi:hypothetical protein
VIPKEEISILWVCGVKLIGGKNGSKGRKQEARPKNCETGDREYTKGKI